MTKLLWILNLLAALSYKATASKLYALLLVVPLASSTGNCPGTYLEYSGRCLNFVSDPPQDRANALLMCRADENGWLATLDNSVLATGVKTFFDMNSVLMDVYFGLHKTAPCTTPCAGLLSWEARTGETPSTTGYTTDMKK